MSIEEEQVRRVNALVEKTELAPGVNGLYAMRGVALPPDPIDLRPPRRSTTTRKTDLVEDQSRHPPFGRVSTSFPLS